MLLPDREDRIYLSPYSLISLKDTGIRGSRIATRELDQENLESLLVSDPTTWPPIKVTKTAMGYVVIDGNHRLEAAQRQGLDRLLATCSPFAHENDVIEAAFRANLHHGLKASSENRSDYAYWLHVTYPRMEQAEIAQRVGVTQSTVSKAIARREEEVRRARLVEEEVDEKTRRSLVKKSCRSFTRGALRFLREVDGLDDGELMQTLQEVVKSAEDKAKLARIGRLLSTGDLSTTQTTAPLRLRQFTGPGPSHATEQR
jgi:ParB-like chromosome segregation protein Spo0J